MPYALAFLAGLSFASVMLGTTLVLSFLLAPILRDFSISPVTASGEILPIVALLCAVLFAAVLALYSLLSGTGGASGRSPP
jgi:hypothetical protein